MCLLLVSAAVGTRVQRVLADATSHLKDGVCLCNGAAMKLGLRRLHGALGGGGLIVLHREGGMAAITALASQGGREGGATLTALAS